MSTCLKMETIQNIQQYQIKCIVEYDGKKDPEKFEVDNGMSVLKVCKIAEKYGKYLPDNNHFIEQVVEIWNNESKLFDDVVSESCNIIQDLAHIIMDYSEHFVLYLTDDKNNNFRFDDECISSNVEMIFICRSDLQHNSFVSDNMGFTRVINMHPKYIPSKDNTCEYCKLMPLDKDTCKLCYRLKIDHYSFSVHFDDNLNFVHYGTKVPFNPPV